MIHISVIGGETIPLKSFIYYTIGLILYDFKILDE